MTLQDLFDHVAAHPRHVVFYFSIIPFAALLAGWLDRDRGHFLPWNYIYSLLIYLVAVPGIFAFTLNLYLFLFEQRSIMQLDLILQGLPILSMILTLLLIRNNVDLDYIPGFDKLSGLLIIITVVLAIMWFIDRTRIWAIIPLRFEFVLLLFFVLLIVLRYGWRKLFGMPYRSRR